MQQESSSLQQVASDSTTTNQENKLGSVELQKDKKLSVTTTVRASTRNGHRRTRPQPQYILNQNKMQRVLVSQNQSRLSTLKDSLASVPSSFRQTGGQQQFQILAPETKVNMRIQNKDQYIMNKTIEQIGHQESNTKYKSRPRQVSDVLQQRQF